MSLSLLPYLDTSMSLKSNRHCSFSVVSGESIQCGSRLPSSPEPSVVQSYLEIVLWESIGRAGLLSSLFAVAVS